MRHSIDRRRQELVAAGLCRDGCGRPLATKTYCRACADKRQEQYENDPGFRLRRAQSDTLRHARKQLEKSITAAEALYQEEN